jgi:uncharacterized protein YdhG (YjbR/CyaY superfamily)
MGNGDIFPTEAARPGKSILGLGNDRTVTRQPQGEEGGKVKTPEMQFATIDEYIRTFPKEVQGLLEEMRQTIRKAAPEAVEAISYRMPTFKLNGRNLAHFAGYKKHIGFYPVPSGIEAFKEELSSYVQGKGSVQFPLNQPIPYDLVSRIVAFRVRESQQVK